LKDEVRDVGDEAERATRETENSLELRTRDRYRKLISKIASTLKRVDSGDYGFCVDTGEEIGLERLEARLTAERTIDAQERWEHRQKQMGDGVLASPPHQKAPLRRGFLLAGRKASGAIRLEADLAMRTIAIRLV